MVLGAPSWFPIEKFPPWLPIATVGVLFIFFASGTGVPFALGWMDEESAQALGYVGIFLINFLATAAWFVPVPPIAGHVAIIVGAQTLFKPGVVVAGASGMTLAESTAYVAGMLARGLSEDHQLHLVGPVGRLLRGSGRLVNRLTIRYGFLTLMILSAVPNPVFEFAGIAAGAVRMRFWRFLIAVGIGKTARVILLVVAGDAILHLFRLK